jgi:hypothetical protein
MSLLNLIADKTSGSALANNRALSKFTTTTYAQAGTSLPEIVSKVQNDSIRALGDTGITESSVMAPINAMQRYASLNDANNASVYTAQADNIKNSLVAKVEEALPGYNNSLFDIQKISRESLSSAVDSYGAAISSVNSTISEGAINEGVKFLPESGRTLDLACTSSYGTATVSAQETVNTINKTIADKVQLEQSLGVNEEIVELPEATSTGSGSVNTSVKIPPGSAKGINESDIIAPSAEQNSTDVIYQEVKIYVEGVQVPFESCSISQAIGTLPSAMFQVPPQSGLMDIARYYQPKVHIFYTDSITGGDRLLFWGHIIACNYSRSQAQSNATISFQCIHKNALMQQLTFEWSAGGAGNVIQGGSLTDVNPNQAAVQLNNFNSEASLLRCLQGIVGVQTDNKDFIDPSNPTVIDADPALLAKRFSQFEKRLVGMPSAVMNLWNQVKLEVYSDEKLNTIFSKMYVPLIEDGIRFFDRLSGHFVVENQVQSNKVDHCNNQARPELSKHKTMLPPIFNLDIRSAVQSAMAIETIKTELGFSGEMTSFMDLFANFYYAVEYEMLTLASPAEVPVDPQLYASPDDYENWKMQDKMAIETIIKPQMPFYYSPICNVLLPNMYHTISVSQNESGIPTRITGIDTGPARASNQPHLIGLNYRGPHSIRESIALAITKIYGGIQGREDKTVTLKDTTGSSYNLPGKYEMGRGILHKKIAMPNWLSHFSSDQDKNRGSASDQEYPEKGSQEYKNILNLHYAWIEKYGYKNEYDSESGEIRKVRDNSLDTLNPFSDKAGIMAYERLLFSSVDYEYTKEIAKSRSGTVEALFNPYIIPGYPMDIIDASPNHPSFHAVCSSVTHSITPRYLGTSIGFMAATTYTEMSNYYMAPVHPWLRNALSMVNISRTEKLSEGSDLSKDAVQIKTADPVISTEKTIFNAAKDSQLYNEQEDQRQKEEQQFTQSLTQRGIIPDPKYDTNTGDIESIQQGLINNPRAKAVADAFYRSVLGIASADPAQMYDFEKGGILPVKRVHGAWGVGEVGSHSTSNHGEKNDNLTGVGNLRLVHRPIEGKKAIEYKFDLKFIDLTPTNYTATGVTYQNKIATSSEMVEPGASMFLDYEEIEQVIDSVKNVPSNWTSQG